MSDQAQQETKRTAAQARASIMGTLASVVRWAGLVIVLVLVIRVLLTVGGANPHNGITKFITSWSDPLAWGFKSLFTPADTKLRVLVNYGIAALCWLIVSSILARIIRRFA
jgi:uncharacterized protein YggT (Ycf19 family)